MRKIKIMLFSLLVLGVVGGALAFKAKYNKIYCTSTIPVGLTTCREAGAGANVFCNNLVASTTEIGATNNVCYTEPPAGSGCLNLRCITTPRTFKTNQ